MILYLKKYYHPHKFPKNYFVRKVHARIVHVRIAIARNVSTPNIFFENKRLCVKECLKMIKGWSMKNV